MYHSPNIHFNINSILNFRDLPIPHTSTKYKAHTHKILIDKQSRRGSLYSRVKPKSHGIHLGVFNLRHILPAPAAAPRHTKAAGRWREEEEQEEGQSTDVTDLTERRSG